MGVTQVNKATEATVTSMGKGLGTFPYMAPEMFRKVRRSTVVDRYRHSTEIMMQVCGSYDEPPI